LKMLKMARNAALPVWKNYWIIYGRSQPQRMSKRVRGVKLRCMVEGKPCTPRPKFSLLKGGQLTKDGIISGRTRHLLKTLRTIS